MLISGCLGIWGEAVQSMNYHCSALTTSHNELTDNVNYLLQEVNKMKQSWDNWNEWTPIDQKEEEESPTQEIPLPTVQGHETIGQSSRTLLDITPVITPVQRPRELYIGGHEGGTSHVSTPEYDCSRLAVTSLKGVRRIYVDDQTHFKVGKMIIIRNLFMAQVIALGSLVLDRPLDQDYPAGSPIRELTPRDDYVVDARGRAVINGVVMDPSPSPEEHVIRESFACD